LAQAAWFFLPQVAWIGRQMRVDQEFLVDGASARRLGTSGPDYARSLVGFVDAPRVVAAARPGVDPSRPLGSTTALRVLMLLRCPYPLEVRPPAWWRWGLAPLTLAGVLAATSLTLRDPRAAAGTASNPGKTAGLLVRIDQLTVTCDHDRGRAAACVLPVALPARFDLRLEIQVRPIDLPLFTLAGFHVAPPFPESSDPTYRDDPPWLLVRIQREPGQPPRAWVDGEVAAVRPARDVDPSRLAVHSPTDRVARVRRLVLTGSPDRPG
jgi:hypothetical protein